MRLTKIVCTTLFATGLALAANGPKAVTYLEGNLDGFSLATNTTLEMVSVNHFVLHTKGVADVEVPYANVTAAERTTVPVAVEKEPLYKVWDLHKRLMPPEPAEKIALQFKTKSGEAKNVTLELDRDMADRIQVNVRHAQEKRAANSGAWWGDAVWKTKRNQEQWGGAGLVSARE